MDNYNKIKSLGREQFAEFLDKYCQFENSPWQNWFTETYCNKCDGVLKYIPAFNKKCECSYCEINNKCKYFENMESVPDCKQIILLWLRQKYTM